MPEATCDFSRIGSTNVPGANLIAETLQRMRTERGELEEFLESMLASLDDLGAKLTQRQGRLAEHEAELREREAQLSLRQQENENLHQLLQAQAARLETMAEELHSVREELGKKSVAGESSASEAHLQGVVQRLEEQRDDLKQRLDVCREELTRRSDATEQLAKSQVALAAAREEILELREKFDSTRDADDTNVDDQRERIALETELEMVRRRAAELSESLAEQKDQMTHQQAMWAAELNHLRHLMDAHNGAAIHQAAEAQAQPAPTATVEVNQTQPSPAKNGDNDPVVDSIMQQFAKLQQDVAQRRKRVQT